VAAAAGLSAGDTSTLDLDLVMAAAVRHWEKAAAATSRDLQAKFTEADVNGDGVGTHGYCSPRHRMPFNSINEGSHRV